MHGRSRGPHGPMVPGMRVRMIPNRTLPVMRRPGLHGLGDADELAVPGPYGAPGPPLYPYAGDDSLVFAGAAVPGAAPTGIQPTAPVQPYTNFNSFVSVPLTLNNLVPPASGAFPPIVQSNIQRTLLLIQNNSAATSPDTTPNFWVGFNSVPTAAGITGLGPTVAPYLSLPAGFALILDAVPPRESIFVVAGTFTNGGGTAVVAGVLVQAIYSPPGA